MFQKTLASSVGCSGITLHSGVRTKLTLLPAPENTGMRFRRVDMPGAPELTAVAQSVVDVQRATTLAAPNGAMVTTVEHVLSALHALQIDNCIVEMDNIEPPIMDGSALPYVELIRAAGVAEQSLPAKIWSPKAPILFTHKETEMVLTPGEGFTITCAIAFGATAIDTQLFTVNVTPENFTAQIASARTFCQYRELTYLLSAGLAKGGSLDNALVLHDGAIISKDGLRFPDELVRHKILDIVGDLYLCGARVVNTHILAVKPGHPTNVMLAKQMIQQVISQ